MQQNTPPSPNQIVYNYQPTYNTYVASSQNTPKSSHINSTLGVLKIIGMVVSIITGITGIAGGGWFVVSHAAKVSSPTYSYQYTSGNNLTRFAYDLTDQQDLVLGALTYQDSQQSYTGGIYDLFEGPGHFEFTLTYGFAEVVSFKENAPHEYCQHYWQAVNNNWAHKWTNALKYCQSIYHSSGPTYSYQYTSGNNLTRFTYDLTDQQDLVLGALTYQASQQSYTDGIYDLFEGPGHFEFTLTYGFAEVVSKEDASGEYCARYNEAVRNNWAHKWTNALNYCNP